MIKEKKIICVIKNIIKKNYLLKKKNYLLKKLFYGRN